MIPGLESAPEYDRNMFFDNSQKWFRLRLLWSGSNGIGSGDGTGSFCGIDPIFVALFNLQNPFLSFSWCGVDRLDQIGLKENCFAIHHFLYGQIYLQLELIPQLQSVPIWNQLRFWLSCQICDSNSRSANYRNHNSSNVNCERRSYFFFRNGKLAWNEKHRA